MEPSRLEREVIKRIRRSKLFVWLREHRHELLDADFEAELAGSRPHTAGQAAPRVKVEHTLAHAGAGRDGVPATSASARTCSTYARVAVIHNLHVIARQPYQPGNPPEADAHPAL